MMRKRDEGKMPDSIVDTLEGGIPMRRAKSVCVSPSLSRWTRMLWAKTISCFLLLFFLKSGVNDFLPTIYQKSVKIV
jgi:hypothetical protein